MSTPDQSARDVERRQAERIGDMVNAARQACFAIVHMLSEYSESVSTMTLLQASHPMPGMPDWMTEFETELKDVLPLLDKAMQSLGDHGNARDVTAEDEAATRLAFRWMRAARKGKPLEDK